MFSWVCKIEVGHTRHGGLTFRTHFAQDFNSKGLNNVLGALIAQLDFSYKDLFVDKFQPKITITRSSGALAV